MSAFISGLLGGIGQSMQRQREQKTLMDLQRQRQMSEMLMDMANDPNITPEQANEARARGLGLMTGQMKMKPGELEQWATDWYVKTKQIKQQELAQREEMQRQQALEAMSAMPPPTMANLQAAAVPPPPNVELAPARPITQSEIAMDRQSQAEQQRYRSLYGVQREERVKSQEEERTNREKSMERDFGKDWRTKFTPQEVAEILNPGINLPRPTPPPHLGTPKTWIGPDGKEFMGVFNPITKMVETESGQFPLSTVKEKDTAGSTAAQHDQEAYEAYAQKLGIPVDKLNAGQKIEARAWAANQLESPDQKAMRLASTALNQMRLLQLQEGMAGTGEVAEADPQAKEILGQTGLSVPAFYVLTGQSQSLPRDRATRQRAMKEAENFARRRGVDVATMASRYKSYNKVLGDNVERLNRTAIMEQEVQAAIQNLQDVVKQQDLKKLRVANVAKLWAGQEVNDPLAQQYAVHLQQIRTDLTAYNAAAQGRSGNQILDADKKEAEAVIKAGLASGSLQGLSDAITNNMKKMDRLLKGSVDRTGKAVWDLFGVGKNYPSVSTSAQETPPPPSTSRIKILKVE